MSQPQKQTWEEEEEKFKNNVFQYGFLIGTILGTLSNEMARMDEIPSVKSGGAGEGEKKKPTKE